MLTKLIRLSKPFSDAPKLVDHLPRHTMQLDLSTYFSAHPIYTKEDAEKVEFTHESPRTISDCIAFRMVWLLRKSFDLLTYYDVNKMNERKYLDRFLMLESIAGVPGMVGAMNRHLRSLRNLKRDNGWIRHLLEEAENERMHLFIFLNIKQPGFFLKSAIFSTQFVFFISFFAMYLLSPRACHRFVGYLEEEAVKTYTHCLKDLDEGKLKFWENKKAPQEAISYYNLSNDATFRDVILSVRADEAMHRGVNHFFADLKPGVNFESSPVEIREKEKKE